jgi:hypothetical protein
VPAVATGRTARDVLGLEHDDCLALTGATLAREIVGERRALEAGADDDDVGRGGEACQGIRVRVERAWAAIGCLPVRDGREEGLWEG